MPAFRSARPLKTATDWATSVVVAKGKPAPYNERQGPQRCSAHRARACASSAPQGSGMLRGRSRGIVSKQTVVICACIFLGGFVAGQAASTPKPGYSHDGQHWRELTDFQRILYVRGFSLGYQDATTTKEALAGKYLDDAQRVLLTKVDRYLAGKAEGRHKVGEIVNAITTFYGDYRNVSVCWEPAITFSVMSVYGSPPSNAELAGARQGSASGGCE